MALCHDPPVERDVCRLILEILDHAEDLGSEADAGVPRSSLEPLAQAPGFGFAFRR